MDVWCFKEDKAHSSSSSGSLSHIPFNEHWSSISGMDDNFVAGISHDEIIDRVDLVDSNILNSSVVRLDELSMVMKSVGSTFQPASSFRPYRLEKGWKGESMGRVNGQKMIKKAHSMLRNLNLMKEEGRMEEGATMSAYQIQHMVSERRRRERLNASFHTLWMLLPPGSKKDKTSVLCKTVAYVKSMKAEIYDLEEKNRALEINEPPAIISQSERVRVQISKIGDQNDLSTRMQIELMIIVEGVPHDLIRVVLGVLECVKDMNSISLLSLDSAPNSQHFMFLATIRLAINESSYWDDRSFEEAITRAAFKAMGTTAY